MISTVLVFLNILLIELILSVDNAAALAIVVNKQLPDEKDRKKALRYGIIGAYVFRGLSLFLVGWLLYNPTYGAIAKILGGLWLCRLFYKHLTPEVDSTEEGKITFVGRLVGPLKLNAFWTTVLMVEFLDMVFSVDNLLAVVSLSSNMWIVVSAVFLGILGMRFVAQYFSTLLKTYPSLEGSAFVVILLLGIKMALAGLFDFFPDTTVHSLLNSHLTDLGFSVLTLLVFVAPIFKAKFLGDK